MCSAEPRSIDSKVRCFYCASPYSIIYPAAYPTGIAACADHAEVGQREYRTYMTESGQVWAPDAVAALPEFFGCLTPAVYFSVPRSSGAWDPGWRFDPTRIIQRRGTQWFLPVFKRSSLGDLGHSVFGASAAPALEKLIDIREFCDPAMGLAGMTKDLMRAARRALIAGIYMDA